MGLGDLAGGLVRRWYLVVLGLGVAAVLAGLTLQAVPPQWTATSRVLLVPPAGTVRPSDNPLLGLDGLGQAVDVLSQDMNSANVLRTIASRAPGADVVIGPDALSSAPILLIQATATSASGAQDAAGAARAAVPASLVDVQKSLGVRGGARITSQDLPSDPPLRSRKKQVELAGGVGLVVVLATLMVVAVLDGRVQTARRRSTRPSRGRGRTVPAGRDQ